MIWFHSVHNFGLGNTISCTPAIKKLSQRLGKPIPVYFDLPFVRDCFIDCEFIHILKTKPREAPLFTSVLTNTTHNTRPDYQFIYHKVTGEQWDGQRCYVDEPKLDAKPYPYFVMVAGSGNEIPQYLATKTIARTYFLDAMRASKLQPIFVGSENDLKRNEWAIPYARDIGNVRKALAWLSGAAYVVGNDTGLIHAAGAMDKKMFVFWKDTQLPRCANSGTDCTYLMKSEHGRIGRLIEGLV